MGYPSTHTPAFAHAQLFELTVGASLSYTLHDVKLTFKPVHEYW